MKNESQSTILVTGAIGTVGSEVVKPLASSGQRIKAAFVHKIKLINSKKIKRLISLVSIITNQKLLPML